MNCDTHERHRIVPTRIRKDETVECCRAGYNWADRHAMSREAAVEENERQDVAGGPCIVIISCFHLMSLTKCSLVNIRTVLTVG